MNGVKVDGFRALEHLLRIAAYLVEHGGVCERDRLAIRVIQLLGERDGLLDMRHRGAFIAEQPERVRVPGVRKDAEIRPQGGTLRMPLVVGRQSLLERVERPRPSSRGCRSRDRHRVRVKTCWWRQIEVEW